jgi:L-fuculose-phosphate aldolase
MPANNEGSWSEKDKFVLGCRLLAQEGHAQSLAGQITLRDADADTFWTTQFTIGLAETRLGNMVRVRDDMSVVEGEGSPNPGVRFHLKIYASRPDLACIVHTHPPYTSALSMLKTPLVVAHVDTCMLYDDCAFLAEWPGVPLADDEARLIAGALGDKRSILMAHHGLLTTGLSLEEAVYRAINFERAARLQVLAAGCGEIQPVNRREALDARAFLTSDKMVSSTFGYWARQALRACPDLLL